MCHGVLGWRQNRSFHRRWPQSVILILATCAWFPLFAGQNDTLSNTSWLASTPTKTGEIVNCLVKVGKGIEEITALLAVVTTGNDVCGFVPGHEIGIKKPRALAGVGSGFAVYESYFQELSLRTTHSTHIPPFPTGCTFRWPFRIGIQRGFP